MNKAITALLPALALGICVSSPANVQAAQQGDWIVKATLTEISPNSDSDSLNRISRSEIYLDDAASAGFTVTGMVTNNIGVEFFTAWPFTQELNGNERLANLGIDHLAEVKQLPVGINLQYHFQTGTGFRPYIGAGVNYSHFFGEKDRINSIHVKMDDAWGYGGQAGVDLEMANNWLINVDARYIHMDTKAKLSGMIDQNVDMSLNPWLFSVGLGYRF